MKGFEVAKSDDALYVRVQGLGSMTSAPALEAFVDHELQAGGVRQLVLDLADCSGVDSTFMGTLLGLNNRLGDQGEGSGVALVNVDDHARKQLSSVGLDAFLTLVEGETRLPKKLRLTPLPAKPVGDRERLKLMLKAHKDLVAADERNRAKFGPFLEAIVAELGDS